MPFHIKVKQIETQFSIVFQPVIDLEENKAVAMEVLSRATHGKNIESTLKQISLDGNNRQFTLALLGEVASVSGFLPKTIRYLSINITMDHLCSSYLYNDLKQLLSKLSERQISLVVELPEGEPYPKLTRCAGRNLLSNIKKLQRNGILIAIDDYGKGFNVGEDIVSNLMPDIIKIDRNVVQQPNNHQGVWSSIESIMKSYRVRVVAEGIENIEELNFVVNAGIKLCQGFYFGRPRSL
ncbi:EAL domain-containing protein [Vibrio lentus]|uniref:EAL domain-containing protein n=1 Tax=Vibrio lentus TaxID=136468 RepID=UPI000C85EFE8|nr:EAL domain-containing protein [Vibrio lentus]MCC4783176.1 EAL domain-containing protein [Vibrio lentus]PMJ04277.1 hypothetical protein BCU31_13830 [Vibrio lentus]TKG22269.1 EAL domain-containing protein [Vibrio lentus]